jgi:peptidoglycan/xylan/chitin deacetylase (PgdA/CDA1 family)
MPPPNRLCRALSLGAFLFTTLSFADPKAPAPKEWGTRVTGTHAHFVPDGNEIALTFDVCRGKELDDATIAVLEREQVCATLFVAGPWLRENPEKAAKLVQNPLFEIENHGAGHRPLSSTGRSIFGIQGTRSLDEVAQEIECNATTLEALTGRRPKLFRPGTGFCDEIAVKAAEDLGYSIVTFDTIGDEGATLAGRAMTAAILRARPGSIVVLHLHRPRPGAAEAVDDAIAQLRKEGVRFVKLGERQLCR